MKNPLRQPALVVVIGILGFMLAMAFNTTTRLQGAQPERASDLASVVQDMEAQRDSLEIRLAGLRDEVTALEEIAATEQGIRDSFTQQIEVARLAAGLTGVKGPGVSVVLGDGSDVIPGTDPNLYLIHDSDIAAVVNALFVGGAEAVDVNGERVVATTPIRCAGSTVLVNARRLGGPYTVNAVGDSDALYESVVDDPAAGLLFEAYRTQFGLDVSVTRLDEVEVSAYRGSFRPTYAVQAEEEDV